MDRVEIFFYGLFMDETVLAAKGVQCGPMQAASVAGFRLCVGKRATLKAAEGGTVHGMVGCILRSQVERLYAEPDLMAYRPETVVATFSTGEQRSVLCFNLPESSPQEAPDPAYLAQLRRLARRLKLPSQYVASIK